MANQKLSALTSIPVIDRTADIIYIVDVSAGTSNKVTPNFLLGITGAPLGTTDSATVSNKILDNSNTLTIKDTSLIVQDDGDTTKQFKFQASGITTSTTRTFTVPNFDATFATLAGTETFTNKTLTSPTINTATIVNPTITANSIAGFSASTTGTIYGVGITTGVITGAGTIGTGTIVANGVAANQLATNAITLGYTQITSAFTTASTSYAQVTSLTATVTIPAGGRKTKITVQFRSVSNTNAATGNFISIWDGVVGSGTQLQEYEVDITSATFNNGGTVIAVVTPSAGSKTYNVGVKTTAGTLSLNAAATYPAFILVEEI